MNERIRKLREQSLKAVPCISVERAVLVTGFYKSKQAEGVSEPVRRALAFDHILRNKTIYLGDDPIFFLQDRLGISFVAMRSLDRLWKMLAMIVLVSKQSELL